jgi:putative transposase
LPGSKKNLASELTRNERLELLDWGSAAELSLTQQAELLSLSRTHLYYKPAPPSEREVQIKHRLDELYTEAPFLGSRKIALLLARGNLVVGRHTIRHYRAEMGLATLFPKPKLSQPGTGPENRVFPYLLRNLPIERPNQVWGVDITYVRMASNWMYLVAFLDWYSRYVVAWEISESLEIPFVLDCCEEALESQVPEIVNSDQGSHFTSERFTSRFLAAGTRISMDGRGRYVDNIFTERLWRSVKYEEVYLNEYACPREVRQGLARYFTFYNERRPHQALGYATPAQIYNTSPREWGERHFLKIAPKLS